MAAEPGHNPVPDAALPRARTPLLLTPWIVLALALLALGSLIAYDLQREHAALHSKESRRLEHQSEVVDVNLARQLQLTSDALDTVRTDLPWLQSQPDGQQLVTRALRVIGRGMTGVRSLTLADANGKLMASSRHEPGQPLQLDSENYRRLRESRNSEMLYISAPVTSPEGGITLHLSKLVMDAQGRMAGSLTVELDSSYFGVLLRSALYAPDMRAGLVHGDGLAIYRAPDPEGVAGMNLAAQPNSFTARHLRSGRKSSLLEGTAASTGEHRLMALRNVLPESSPVDKPLVIFLGREMSELYAEWRKDLAVRAALFGAIALVSALGLLMLQRRQLAHEHLLADQQAAREQAERQLHEQQAGRSEVEEKLRDSQARFSRLLEDMRQAVILLEDGRCTAANRAALAMFRLEQLDQLLGKTPLDFSPLRQPDGRLSAEKTAEMVWIATELGSNVFEWEHVRANGEPFMTRVQLSVTREAGKDLLHLVLHDITEQKMARQEIEFLAFHDELTGLPNRVLGREQLQRLLASATASWPGLAVLHISLHRLSAVNEAYGQSVGDHLLLSVAMRLGHVLRPQDLLSRRAGDGFMVVLPEIDSYPKVAKLCDEILARCGSPFGIEGMQISCALSLGVAFHPRDGEDADTLIRNADMALRQARKAGPDCCYFFEPQMTVAAERYAQTREALRRGLERGEFELHYEPRLELAQNEVVGFEAQLQWRRNGQVQQLAGELLDAARDSGLIVPLGRWALQQACQQASIWQQQGHKLQVSVGLSALQCRGGQAERDLLLALRESGLAPGQLELLLPANIVQLHDEAAVAMLARCSELGVQLCLDDYGGGYLNLTYLRQLRVGKLRLDLGTLTQAGQLDQAQLRTLLHGARELGLATGTSDVESGEVLGLLRELGCNEVQGPVLAAAMPAEAVASWLQQQSQG